jgi:RND family efflux transporter MFP subunit
MDDKETAKTRAISTDAGPRPAKCGGVAALVTAMLAVVLAVGIFIGIRAREKAESKLQQATYQAAILEVRTVHPQQAAPIDEIVLPGATQPYINSPIYARASGYLVEWYHDIGSRVKKGDVLAVIDAPEIDKQLQQARSDLQTSLTNADLAKIAADRWQGLISTRSVSKQSTDQAVDNQKAAVSSVNSYAANEAYRADLVSFEKIYAPFDGVITARHTDNGWLIAAGQNTPDQELFQISQIGALRVFVAVPEVYWRAARVGVKVNLTLDEYPNQSFPGRVTRTSDSIDMASRTLNTEVDIDNSRGLLLPGAYVQVHLALPRDIPSVIIPSSTLLFRGEGLRVGVVRNNVAQLVPITIGTDYGETVTVVSGRDPNDQVIESPSDSLVNGTPVHITQPDASGTKP